MHPIDQAPIVPWYTLHPDELLAGNEPASGLAILSLRSGPGADTGRASTALTAAISSVQALPTNKLQSLSIANILLSCRIKCWSSVRRCSRCLRA
jgi:hypothetical protein